MDYCINADHPDYCLWSFSCLNEPAWCLTESIMLLDIAFQGCFCVVRIDYYCCTDVKKFKKYTDQKNWRASPPARQPASPRAGPKKVARFTVSGQPGPTHLIRAKIGPGQNGPGWPVLTPLVISKDFFYIT